MALATGHVGHRDGMNNRGKEWLKKFGSMKLGRGCRGESTTI